MDALPARVEVVAGPEWSRIGGEVVAEPTVEPTPQPTKRRRRVVRKEEAAGGAQ